MDGVLYFIHRPAYYLTAGPSYTVLPNHRPPLADGCEQRNAGVIPTSIYPVVLWELWVSILWPQSSGPSCTQWAAKTLSYWGKNSNGLDKKRCCPQSPGWGEVLGAVHAGVSDGHGSAEPLAPVRCTPWGRLSRLSAQRHQLIKPVTNGQKVYCPCTAAYDPINHRE